MTTNTTQIGLGDAVLQVESWDQLPMACRQELRKLGMQMLELARPHSVTFIQLAPKGNLREASK